MSLRTRALTVLTVVVLLGAAACGQKSGVAGTGVQADGGGSGGGGTTGGGGTATTGGGTGGGEHEPGSDDTAGITDDEIVIGIHAPVTGASPIPQNSFDTGKDIYWKFLAQSDPEALGGRKVRVVFRDDEFNPSRAVQVCREMVENENAFVLVGGGGADQITACAKYASRERGAVLLGRRERGGAHRPRRPTSRCRSPTPSRCRCIDRAPSRSEERREGRRRRAADTPSFQDGARRVRRGGEGRRPRRRRPTTRSTRRPARPRRSREVQKLKHAGAEVVFLLSQPARVPRARQRGPQPGLRARVRRPRHHERPQRGAELRLSRGRQRRSSSRRSPSST